MERAYKLRDEREAKRLEFVKQCYDAQWRDACDDARTLDSKAMDKFVGADRLAQIQEKQRKKEALSAAENAWIEEYNKHCDKLEAIERAKDDFRANAARDLQEGLRRQVRTTSIYSTLYVMPFEESLIIIFITTQMEENEGRQIENMERNQKESEDEIREIQRALAEEAELQKKLKEDAYLSGKEVLLFNEKYKTVRQDEEALERRQDAQLLAYAMRKEREAIAEEEAKKNANKHAAQVYRKYLEEMMIKDAEDNSGLDEVRKAEENKIWKARDDVLKAREDARKYLMKLVDEGRQEQIAYKRQQLQKEKEDAKIYSQKFLIDASEGVAKERAETQRRRLAAEENNRILSEQIEIRRQRQELEKQEEYLANKHMERIERLHRQKLSEQAGNLRTNFPVSSTKWYM